uniref:Uncharacterized protein n=2 Tax=Chrysotila carterae TaxID=13221 RepID=A0A7S4F4Y0_CHRCT
MLATCLLLLFSGATAVDPLSKTITVFHVNPLREGVIPVNMDTADLRGDMFFDVHSKTLPIQCAVPPPSIYSRIDCSNPEVVASDLVITKLQLNMRPSDSFGEYGRCNLCNATGVDPFSRLPCTPHEYFCTCGTYFEPYACNDIAAIGAENINVSFGGFPKCSWETWVTGPWQCWGFASVSKFGGMWYSTTRAGWCDAPGADPATCTWRATVDKIVNKSCSDDIVHQAVEDYDAEHDACFSTCPGPVTGSKRNTSSVCWIYCFYQTVMGKETIMPGGKARPNVGMPLAELDAAFLKPFLPESQGKRGQ